MSTTPNVPLLRKALEWAEAEAAKTDPAECQWDQTAWISSPAQRANRDHLRNMPTGLVPKKIDYCETSYCIAGWVVAVHARDEYQLGECNSTMTYSVNDVSGTEHSIGDVAAGLLQLRDGDAEELFSGHNTITELREIAERIAGEKL